MGRMISMDYRGVSLEDGIKIVRDRDGEHVPYTGQPVEQGPITPGEHWTGKWLSHKDGAWAVLVIKPVSREARKLVREHYIQEWSTKYSVDRELARKIYQMDIPFKRELIEDICRGMNDEKSHVAFTEFPGAQYVAEWAEAYPEVSKSYCVRNKVKDLALLEAIKSLLFEAAASS